jgi:hypothetical protein
MPTLGTPQREDTPPPLRLHPSPEPMGACALDPARLIGALHRDLPAKIERVMQAHAPLGVNAIAGLPPSEPAGSQLQKNAAKRFRER